MILNLIKNNKLIKRKKNIYNFSILICLKSHIKFRENSEQQTIKLNLLPCPYNQRNQRRFEKCMKFEIAKFQMNLNLNSLNMHYH